MKKGLLLFVFLFFVFSVSGFETKYYFGGYDWPTFHTQSPNHESITTRAFGLVCSRQKEKSSTEGLSFINETLSPFLDEPMYDCAYGLEPFTSIKMGVGCH